MNFISKNIISDWHLTDLSEQEQIDFMSRIGKLIYQALLVRSLDILSTTEEEELDILLDKDETSQEDVVSFLQKKIPTFDLLLWEEMNKLREDIVV